MLFCLSQYALIKPKCMYHYFIIILPTSVLWPKPPLHSDIGSYCNDDDHDYDIHDNDNDDSNCENYDIS
jgi:hypothetical protein